MCESRRCRPSGGLCAKSLCLHHRRVIPPWSTAFFSSFLRTPTYGDALPTSPYSVVVRRSSVSSRRRPPGSDRSSSRKRSRCVMPRGGRLGKHFGDPIILAPTSRRPGIPWRTGLQRSCCPARCQLLPALMKIKGSDRSRKRRSVKALFHVVVRIPAGGRKSIDKHPMALLAPPWRPNYRSKPKPRHLVGKKIILILLTNPMHREIASRR